jgi:hypothetical protein
MRWQATFDRLDALSRKRALTDTESAMLEKAIREMDAAEATKAATGQPLQHWTPEEDARLCDLIADGCSIAAAGRIMGKSKGSAAGRFKRIRAEMGWQAR